MTLPGAKKHLAGAEKAVDLRSECRGAIIFVDAFVWLHVFCVVFSEALAAEDYSSATAVFVTRIRRQSQFGVTCYPVFDGDGTEAKAVETSRRDAAKQRRLAALQRRVEEEQGKKLSAGEIQKLRAAAGHITPGLVAAVLDALREAGIAYLVAPFEADHQMVHLARVSRRPAYVATVDQDLLVHAKLRVLLDVDWLIGTARLFDLSFFAAGGAAAAVAAAGAGAGAAGAKRKRGVPAPNVGRLCALLRRHGHGAILAYALLSHTDYGGFKGVGEVTVLKALERCADGALDTASLVAALRAVAGAAVKKLPADAETLVERTRTAFLGGLVYDPKTKAVRPLDGRTMTPDLAFLGEVPSPEEAALRAVGLRCHRSGCKCAEDASHRHKLVPLKALVRPGDTQPSRLRFDQVPGSQLDEEALKANATKFTVAQLDAFLTARRYPLTRGTVADKGNEGASKAPKVAYVLEVLKEERESKKPVQLYSPNAVCLLDMLIALGEERAEDWPQYDNALARACAESTDWIEGQPSDAKLSGAIPVMTDAVVCAHWAQLGAEQEGGGAHIRALEQGFRRIATRAVLENFAYLPKVPLDE